MSDRTRIRRAQVPCIEVTRTTSWGPDQSWPAVCAVTEWSNGDGVDVSMTLGPHDSGSMRLTWEEVEVLRVALAAVTDGREVSHD